MHWDQDTKEARRLYDLPKVLLRSSLRFRFMECIVNDNGVVKYCRFELASPAHAPTAVLVIDEPQGHLRQRLFEKVEALQGELAAARSLLSLI